MHKNVTLYLFSLAVASVSALSPRTVAPAAVAEATDVPLTTFAPFQDQVRLDDSRRLLFPRQACDFGSRPCGTFCMPTQNQCCSAGFECPAGEYCTKDILGNGGCCFSGEICGGIVQGGPGTVIRDGINPESCLGGSSYTLCDGIPHFCCQIGYECRTVNANGSPTCVLTQNLFDIEATSSANTNDITPSPTETEESSDSTEMFASSEAATEASASGESTTKPPSSSSNAANSASASSSSSSSAEHSAPLYAAFIGIFITSMVSVVVVL